MHYLPGDNVYLSHASSGNDLLGLVTQEELRSVFKINCLFFDRISIMSIGLLGGANFSNWSNSERDALAEMFNSGLLCPVIRYPGPETLAEIANRMISSATGHAHSRTDEILELAEFIDSAGCRKIWSPEHTYRERYRHVCFNLLKTLSDQMVDSAEIDRVLEYIEKEDTLVTTKLWAFCKNDTATESVRKILIASEFAAQFAQSSTIGAELSTPHEVGVNSALLTDEIPEFEFKAPDREEVYVDLPLSAIDALPLQCVLEIRNLPEFRAFRKYFSVFRADGSASIAKIGALLFACREALVPYFEGNAILRSVALSRNRRHGRRLLVERTAHGANVALVTLSTFSVTSSLLVPLSSFCAAIASGYARRDSGRQSVFLNQNDKRYLPASGELKDLPEFN